MKRRNTDKQGAMAAAVAGIAAIPGLFGRRRQQQSLDAIHNMIIEQIRRAFHGNPEVKARLSKIDREVLEGRMSPTQAAMRLLAVE
ncbi:MAG: hypothetical protein LBI87_15295 [Candidatus Accumulibacter sp.]|jgi:putative protein kinase ArgK-like GTPase of G3E family|nr:hypothetical protein [Accumulibacter sp.]